MSREDLQTNLRLPADLKAHLNEAAKANNRSMNAEVVARLQESFEARRPSEEVTSRLNALSTDLSMAIALIGELREMAEERQREQNMPTGDLDSELPSVSIKKNEKKA